MRHARSRRAACARDPVVTGADTAPAGNWRIERQVDRITGAPISSAFLVTSTVSTAKVVFPPPAQMQLACLKEQPAVVFLFQFQVGSNRNAELGYRFDAKSGHEAKARFVDDYKTVIIEDRNEVARFIAEPASSNVLYVLIRSLNHGRSSAEFRLNGTPAAINAALAGCPVAPGKSAGIAAMPGRAG